LLAATAAAACQMTRIAATRPLADFDKPQNLVLARLYRFRAPRLIDELFESISAAVQKLQISTT